MTEQEQAGSERPGGEEICAAVVAAFDASGDTGSDQPPDPVEIRHRSWSRAIRPGCCAREPGHRTAGNRKMADSGNNNNPSVKWSRPEPDRSAALVPPPNWKTSDKEIFNTLPEPAQKFLLDRHKAMEADHTRKTQAIAEFRREYEPVDQLFAPHRAFMKERGISSREVIDIGPTSSAGWAGRWRQRHQGYRPGLCHRSGADRGGVRVLRAGAPGGRQIRRRRRALLGRRSPCRRASKLRWRTSRASRSASPPRTAPARRRREPPPTRRGRSAQPTSRISGVPPTVMAICSTPRGGGRGGHGPARPHRAGQGQAVPPLQELYEKAVRANPSTYQALRIAEAQSAQQRQKDEARAKAAAAKKAGSASPELQAPASRRRANHLPDRFARRFSRSSTMVIDSRSTWRGFVP